MVRPWSVGWNGADTLIQGSRHDANIRTHRPRVTKAAKLPALLQTGKGVSLEDMTGATGSQPHTVRAAMTGLKKKGHAIGKYVEGNTAILSAKAAAA